MAATWVLRSKSRCYVAPQRVLFLLQRVLFFTTRINTRCAYYRTPKKRCKIIRVLRCTHLWAKGKAEPPRYHRRGHSAKQNPMEQSMPRAKADQPKQRSRKQDPAGQESKATRQRRCTEPPSSTSLILKIITGCGIVKAPCFQKTSISYRWVLLLLCIITGCYGYYGDDYNIYNRRSTAAHGESYLDTGSIEKCCGANTGWHMWLSRYKY